MKNRAFWIQKVEREWQAQSIIWLPGVRRVGKTTLCRNLPDVEYFDCELPRVRRAMVDPESFLGEVDFVLAERGRQPVAIECKWQADALEIAGLRSFRRRYPEGPNFVVAQTSTRPTPGRSAMCACVSSICAG